MEDWRLLFNLRIVVARRTVFMQVSFIIFCIWTNTGSRTVAAAKISSYMDFDASTPHVDPLYFIDRPTYLPRMLPSLFNFKDSGSPLRFAYHMGYILIWWWKETLIVCVLATAF